MAIGNRFAHPSRAQRGGLINIHRGVKIQSGSGWGSLFGSLFRRAIPAVAKLVSGGAKIAKKVATSKPARELGESMLKTGVEGVADIMSGKDPSEVMQTKLKRAKGDIAKAMRSSVQDLGPKVKSQPALKRQNAVKRKRAKWSDEPLFERKQPRRKKRRNATSS